MKRRGLRLTAVMLAAALASGSVAYADTVEFAAYPGAKTAGNVAGSGTPGGASGNVAAQGGVSEAVSGNPVGSVGPAGSVSGPAAGAVPGITAGSVSDNGSTVPGTVLGSGALGTAGTAVNGTSGAFPGSSAGTATTRSGVQGTAPGSAGSAQQPGNTGVIDTTQPGNAQTGGQTVLQNADIAQPEIASEAAVLMDASTGQVLFSKNADQQLYPASTTKLMTALLVAENADLDAMVRYSASAVENLESGASNANISAGDQMSVRDSLYALLLRSACEVANGLAEHVSGTQEAFAAKMNARAQELGCRNTNFTNASGLNDEKHVTSAYDMALIARAAFQNPTVRSIAGTLSYELPAVQKRGKLTIYNGNKMLNPANEQYYRGMVAGKTGYTSKAGNTLATETEQDGKTLIVVVMKSKGKQYSDTRALLDYGFKLLNGGGVQSSGQSSSGAQQPGAGSTANAAGPSAGSSAGAQTPGSAVNTGSPSAGNSADAKKPDSSEKLTPGWRQNGSEWNYVKKDGTLARSEWVDVDGKSYYIGSDGNMIMGWQKFSNGAYYYFDAGSGAMLRNAWKNEGSGSATRSYYLQDDGTMAVDRVVDTKQGKYRVDANGVAVEKLSN